MEGKLGHDGLLKKRGHHVVWVKIIEKGPTGD